LLKSTNSTIGNAFEQVHDEYDLYLQDLVFHYIEHMQWYEDSFVRTLDCMLEIIDNVYNNHLYCMSWFYEGACLFNSFESEFENSLVE